MYTLAQSLNLGRRHRRAALRVGFPMDGTLVEGRLAHA